MASKFGLGKGLDALLAGLDDDSAASAAARETVAAGPDAGGPVSAGTAGATGELRLPLDLIRANPNQPRRVFDESALSELADSIRESGVIQPVVVELDGLGGYIIVAGERRCRAARLAGLSEIPAVIRSYDDEGRMEAALIENVQRENLNPVEEASAYKRLMMMTGLSQDEVAAKVGKKRSTVANALRLLKLPEEMLAALAEGSITAGHGRALLSVINPADQYVLFHRIMEEGCSVREAEKFAAKLNGGGRASGGTVKTKRPEVKDPDLAAIEQKFIDALGTKVIVSGGLKRGFVKIDYYSMDDLDRLYSILAGGKTAR